MAYSTPTHDWARARDRRPGRGDGARADSGLAERRLLEGRAQVPGPGIVLRIPPGRRPAPVRPDNGAPAQHDAPLVPGSPAAAPERSAVPVGAVVHPRRRLRDHARILRLLRLAFRRQFDVDARENPRDVP